MKKFLTALLATAALISTGASALTAGTDVLDTAPAFTIVVAGQTLDISALPRAPYQEGDTMMVPLCKIAEALGYQVGWDPETGAITVEDSYIQKATLFEGSKTVCFEGKLQIIDMSRDVETAVKTVVHDGSTYVPLEFFNEFLNDTAAEGTTITIAPSMCEIQVWNIG